MDNLKKILLAIRTHKSLSQECAAKKIGISQSQYSKMENGEKPFPLDRFVSLAAVLGLKPSALLDCLFIGISKPDEAIRKAIHELNTPSSIVNKLNNEENNYKILIEYWEEKYFALYREYLELSEK